MSNQQRGVVPTSMIVATVAAGVVITVVTGGMLHWIAFLGAAWMFASLGKSKPKRRHR